MSHKLASPIVASLAFVSVFAQAKVAEVLVRSPRVQPLSSSASCGGSTVNEWRLSMDTDKGAPLHIYSWGVRAPNSRGTLLIVHGLKDHSLRYRDYVCSTLVPAGFSVYALDLPGHGRSSPSTPTDPRPDGEIGSISNAVVVLNNFDRFMREQIPADEPVALMGHSMGGLIAASYAVNTYPSLSRPNFKAVVLSAPALMNFRGLLPWIQSGLARVSPSFTPRAVTPDFLKNEFFSHDSHYVTQLTSDPFVYSGRHSIRVAKALVTAISDFQKSVDDRLDTIVNYPGPQPTSFLMLHGRADKVTNPQGSIRFGELLSRRGLSAETQIWDGFYHDLLGEADEVAGTQKGRRDVRQALLLWLEKNLAR